MCVINLPRVSFDTAMHDAQKAKFSLKDLYSKFGQIRSRIWSYLLKKSLMKNFSFCAVLTLTLLINLLYRETLCHQYTAEHLH